MTNDCKLMYQQGVVCHSTAAMVAIIPSYPLGHPSRSLCESLMAPMPTCTLGKDPFPWSTRLNTAAATIPTYPLARDCMHSKHSLGL